MNAIECKNVSKSFHILDGGSVWDIIFNVSDNAESHLALNNITLSVPKGEFVGILGRNGSGKSTLLRTIGGIYSPTEGFISLSGIHTAIYELGVTGNELLTGREFSKRWLRLYDFFSTLKESMAYIEDFSELGTYLDEPIYKYSSGMKARLFFSVATAVPGKIYLIDEVLAVGDEYFQAKCWGRLRTLFKSGASGILATHDWSAVIKICKTAYVLDSGDILHSGNSMKVVERYIGLSRDYSKESYFSDIDKIELESQKDAQLNIPIVVTKPGAVSFGYSIEMFSEGEGWSHILHMDKKQIGINAVGKYNLRLSIPKLPLSEGKYLLNLFLLQEINGEEKAVDVKSWTTGDSVEFIVRSTPERKVQGFLPICWSNMESLN